MQEKICKYIKKRVYEHIAPAYYGKVSLNEIYRLFSDYGSLSDLEKCLDDFQKNGIAEKKILPQGKFYIFKGIALEFGKKWKEDMKKLQMEVEDLNRENNNIKTNIQIIEEIRNIWLRGWESVCTNENTLGALIDYVTKTTWEFGLKSHLNVLQRNEAKLKEIENRVAEIKSKLESSYESIAE